MPHVSFFVQRLLCADYVWGNHLFCVHCVWNEQSILEDGADAVVIGIIKQIKHDRSQEV